MKIRSALGAVAFVAFVAACGAPVGSTLPSTTSATPVAVASPTLGASPRPICSNEHGGLCLGPLAAGTYETVAFATPISYTVPDGWANFEDLPGNFLLVPPGGNLDGVDAGTSDYLGIYQDVAVADASCLTAREPGVDGTPAAMVAALSDRPGLIVSTPTPVEVGGLSGLMIDIALAPDWAGRCPDLPDVAIVPLTIGAGLAGLEHSQLLGFATRLYVLELGSTNIVIEISDVATSPGVTADYESVVAGLRFGG